MQISLVILLFCVLALVLPNCHGAVDDHCVFHFPFTDHAAVPTNVAPGSSITMITNGLVPSYSYLNGYTGILLQSMFHYTSSSGPNTQMVTSANPSMGPGSFSVSWAQYITALSGSLIEQFVFMPPPPVNQFTTRTVYPAHINNGVGYYKAWILMDGFQTTYSFLCNGDTCVEFNSWKHFVLTYNSSSATIQVYLNGNLNNSYILAPGNFNDVQNLGALYFGIDDNSGHGTDSPGTTYLRKMRLYNTSLGASDAQSIYATDMVLDPTPAPTPIPTSVPTSFPTAVPTNNPTSVPTAAPTTSVPTTASPTSVPTHGPTSAPSARPTSRPTAAPTSVWVQFEAWAYTFDGLHPEISELNGFAIPSVLTVTAPGQSAGRHSPALFLTDAAGNTGPVTLPNDGLDELQQWAITWWQYLPIQNTAHTGEADIILAAPTSGSNTFQIVSWPIAKDVLLVIINGRVAVRIFASHLRGLWTHLAVAYDYPAGTVRVAFNGVWGDVTVQCPCCTATPVAPCTTNPVNGTSSPVLSLSAFVLDNGLQASYVDEIRFFTSIPSDVLLQSIYNDSVAADAAYAVPTPQPTTATPTASGFTYAPTSEPTTNPTTAPTAAQAAVNSSVLIVSANGTDGGQSVDYQGQDSIIGGLVNLTLFNNDTSDTVVVVEPLPTSLNASAYDCIIDPTRFNNLQVVAFVTRAINVPYLTVVVNVSRMSNTTGQVLSTQRGLWVCISNVLIRAEQVCEVYGRAFDQQSLEGIFVSQICHTTQFFVLDEFTTPTASPTPAPTIETNASCVDGEESDADVTFLALLWIGFACVAIQAMVDVLGVLSVHQRLGSGYTPALDSVLTSSGMSTPPLFAASGSVLITAAVLHVRSGPVAAGMSASQDTLFAIIWVIAAVVCTSRLVAWVLHTGRFVYHLALYLEQAAMVALFATLMELVPPPGSGEHYAVLSLLLAVGMARILAVDWTSPSVVACVCLSIAWIVILGYTCKEMTRTACS